jgi:hypothetical protein
MSRIPPVPAYLTGLEYIMSGNDNRDNGGYQLDITLSSASRNDDIGRLCGDRVAGTATSPIGDE